MAEMNKKLKVVWICHFDNDEIRKAMGVKKVVPEFANWIPDTAKALAESEEVELHLIAPYYYISSGKSFKLGNIYYHFFNAGIPFINKSWRPIFRRDGITDFLLSKLSVRRLVNRIKPDVIHLQGAENPYYSVTILQFLNKYPVVINLQRMDLEFSCGDGRLAERRQEIEKGILTKFRHFSVRTRKMKEDLLSFNPKGITHWVSYALPKVEPIASEKIYDMVFFARLHPHKGIEDLIRALAKVKQIIPDVKLLVIGSASQEYKNELLEFSKNLGVAESIVWRNKIPTKEELHREVSKARVSVLPTHFDVIPGTIVESMQLGIPVVSYKAGSIPELNDEFESTLLVDIGDVEGMVRQIIRLLTDTELYNLMAERGIRCIHNWFADESVIGQHMDCYRYAIEDFQITALTRRS